MNVQESTEKSEINISFATIILFLVIAVPVVFLGVQGKLSRNGAVRIASGNTMALAELVNAANVEPTFDNFFRLASAYQQKRLFKESIGAYKKAIAINPQSPVAFNNMGVAYSELGMFEEQIDATKKALDLAPGFELAKNNLLWATEQLRIKTSGAQNGMQKN